MNGVTGLILLIIINCGCIDEEENNDKSKSKNFENAELLFEKNSTFTSQEGLDYAIKIAKEWKDDIRLYCINTAEIKDKPRYMDFFKTNLPDFKNDTNFADGRSCYWSYEFASGYQHLSVTIYFNHTIRKIINYVNSSSNSKNLEISLYSEDAIEIAKSDSNFSYYLSNTDDVYLRYRWMWSNTWQFEFETDLVSWNPSLVIDCETKKVIERNGDPV